jgi:hypothetical protein
MKLFISVIPRLILKHATVVPALIPVAGISFIAIGK